MRAKARDARSHVYLAEDRILPDANVWLYLHAPVSGPILKPEMAAYTTAFKSMREVGCTVLLHPFVVGEYLNRYCRIEWEHTYPKRRLDKHARDSRDFRTIAEYAAASARELIKTAQLVAVPTIECPAGDILNRFATGGLDWNDQIVVECCQQNDYLLMTHDYDFHDSRIQLLTTNQKLLEP